MRHFIFLGRIRLSDLFSPYYIDRYMLYNFLQGIASDCGKCEDVLDFGCGKQPYRELFECEKYIGCDVEISGHDSSAKEVDVYYDGHKLPFADETFDLIISTQVFEHVEYIDEIILELYRVLKKDGKMVITVPLCGEEHEKPYDFRRYTSFGLKKDLEAAGFSVDLLGKSTSYKDTIKYLKLIKYDNKYRTNPSFINRIIRAIFTVLTNASFVLFKKHEFKLYDEDMGLSICCVAVKN